MLLRELEPEHYWAFPFNYDKVKRKTELNNMITSGKYAYQLKTDGCYGSFVRDYDGEAHLLTRGRSKSTGKFCEVEDNVFFFKSLEAAFDKPTKIIGEIYYDGGIDRNVGSPLRSKPEKAKSIQSKTFYEEISKTIKFSAKDKKDIELNDFFDKKLKYRIFDVWCYEGESLLETSWLERQKYVKKAVEKINNPLVSGVAYKFMDNNFYEELAKIFENGGEGVVCYDIMGKPEPGKRTAHKTLKVKQELENEVDCFIMGLAPSTKYYDGKEIQDWNYWINERNNQLLLGDYFNAYSLGELIKPVTKNFFYGWCNSIILGVYDGENIIEIGRCSGLTEEFKKSLKEEFSKWYMCPVKITGMMINQGTKTGSDTIAIRHPKLISIRDKDIDVKDCTLSKILEE